ncbi:hypothetical protein BH10PSE6_BH10PSE6_04620 [soil metagenome]
MKPAHIRLVCIVAIALPGAYAFGQTGELIIVPSDSFAHYWVVEGKRTNPAVVEILTRREGTSATIFALRQIDCAARTFRTLGQGDNLEKAKSNNVELSALDPLTEGSISSSLADYACANFR